MEPEANALEAKAVLAASAVSAGALGAVTLYLLPAVFRPWPLALAAVFLAGLAGGLAGWALAGGRHVFPLVLLLLPFYRLGLLILRHGPPPWKLGGLAWLAGDGFPWWAAAALMAATYAGGLMLRYVRIAPREQLLNRPAAGANHQAAWQSNRFAEEDHAEIHCRAVYRMWLYTVVLGALLFTLAGPAGERPPVFFCGALFLAYGLYFTGLAYARRMTAAWREQGVPVQDGTERGWCGTYTGFAWPFFFLLPFLPGGFQPLNPMPFIGRFILGRTGVPPPMPGGMPGGNPPSGPLPPAVGTFSPLTARILGIIFLIVRALLGVLVVAILGAVALAVLWGLARVLLGWARGIEPLRRALGRFLAALAALWRGAARLGARVLARAPRHVGPDGHSAKPPGASWPASPVRALFARFAIWGREHGMALRPSQTPVEIGHGLARLLPGEDAEMALLVDGYRRVRYGGQQVSRAELDRYRKTWERVQSGGDRRGAP
ncbi:MAG: DUF4129 domain-containing protein [Patescibacteria group bacterium]